MADDGFRRIFEASRTPIATADAVTLVFRDANEAYCELLGYSQEELRSLTPLDLTVPEDAERELALFQQVKDAELPAYALEKRFVHRSGRIVWASVSVTVFRDADGEPETGVAICQDVTERVRAAEEKLRFETELLHAQKLESLGLLAGGVAHDFNNILVGIIGNAELARRRVDAQTATLLDDVLASARVAAELCGQMLAYSGGGALEVAPIDLESAARSAIRLLDSHKRATIDFDPGDAPIVVEADLNQFRQLVLNLATNACEATRDASKRVAVSLRRRALTAEEKQAAVLEGPQLDGVLACLEVHDQGVGFSDEALASAFEPFRSTKGAGRGLGLAAVLGIARSNGATLIVQTEQGAGTRFIVALRASERPAPTPIQDAVEPQGTTPISVLVVDDVKAVRYVVTRILALHGHRAHQVSSVASAVSYLDSSEALPDLVVTDLTLDDGSGRDVLDAARRHGVPVVVMTGHALEGAPRPASDLSLLKKPFTPEDLFGAMAELLTADRGG